MSGAFGIGALVSAGLGAPEALIFGSPDPLIIGNVVLSAFEIPERINFGGTQGIHIHRLPGGERIFDVIGREEDPITWSGVFLGSSAMDRAKLLDVMRAQGSTIPLIWGMLSYQIVIKSFQPDYQFAYHVPYKIVCEVLRDNSAPLPNDTVTPEQSVSNDVTSATQAAPTNASPHVVTKTVAETSPNTTTTMTYAPIGTNPSDLGMGSLGDQAQAAGNNMTNSSLSLVDAGPPFTIPGGTDSVTAMRNAQFEADLASPVGQNAPLFTGQ